MDQRAKTIFIREMETVCAHIESLPENNSVKEQISSVTDPGNLRAVFSNMRTFLETGAVPESSQGYSSLPAVVFGLSGVQKLLAEVSEQKLSSDDVRGASEEYLHAYKRAEEE